MELTDNYYVKTDSYSNVCLIEFYNPKANSLSLNLMKSLTEVIHQQAKSPHYKVLVIKSEGTKVFSAGVDIDDLLEITRFDKAVSYFSALGDLLNAMRKSNKMIVGCVQGKAVGGGLGLISACDYVFADETLSIRLSEWALGLGPFVIEPALSRKIRKTALLELVLNPTEWKSAQWTFDQGIINKLTKTTEVHNAALEFAMHLSTYNSQASEHIRKMLWADAENWDYLLKERAKATAHLAILEETREKLQGFKSSKK